MSDPLDSRETIFNIPSSLRGHVWVKRMPKEHGGLMLDADAIDLQRGEVIELRDTLTRWLESTRGEAWCRTHPLPTSPESTDAK